MELSEPAYLSHVDNALKGRSILLALYVHSNDVSIMSVDTASRKSEKEPTVVKVETEEEKKRRERAKARAKKLEAMFD